MLRNFYNFELLVDELRRFEPALIGVLETHILWVEGWNEVIFFWQGVGLMMNNETTKSFSGRELILK